MEDYELFVISNEERGFDLITDLSDYFTFDTYIVEDF